MDISSRIKQYPACEAIDLTDAEKVSGAYHGCGWQLARFTEGTLVELFDPFEHVLYREDVQAEADEALELATGWLANADGEVWLVMCSCYQLCEPRRITLTDAGGLAKLARVLGEKAREFYE